MHAGTTQRADVIIAADACVDEVRLSVTIHFSDLYGLLYTHAHLVVLAATCFLLLGSSGLLSCAHQPVPAQQPRLAGSLHMRVATVAHAHSELLVLLLLIALADTQASLAERSLLVLCGFGLARTALGSIQLTLAVMQQAVVHACHTRVAAAQTAWQRPALHAAWLVTPSVLPCCAALALTLCVRGAQAAFLRNLPCEKQAATPPVEATDSAVATAACRTQQGSLLRVRRPRAADGGATCLQSADAASKMQTTADMQCSTARQQAGFSMQAELALLALLCALSTPSMIAQLQTHQWWMLDRTRLPDVTCTLCIVSWQVWQSWKHQETWGIIAGSIGQVCFTGRGELLCCLVTG